jgi:hypothetical protein
MRVPGIVIAEIMWGGWGRVARIRTERSSFRPTCLAAKLGLAATLRILDVHLHYGIIAYDVRLASFVQYVQEIYVLRVIDDEQPGAAAPLSSIQTTTVLIYSQFLGFDRSLV